MTGRSMAFAWVVAIVLVVAASLAVSVINQKRVADRIAQANIVFLGTSLTQNALPDHREALPLQEVEAKMALRFGIPRGTELELLALAHASVAAEIPTVFVEVNPIIARFNNDPVGCGMRNRLQNGHKTLRQAARFVLRRKDVGANIVVGNEGRNPINQVAIARTFPMRPEYSCAKKDWIALIVSAPDTRIVFFELPRDQLGNDLIGPEMLALFAARADAFAAELGVPLFRPNALGPWENVHFVDQSHMSRKGSERFREELAIWWAAHR